MGQYWEVCWSATPKPDKNVAVAVSVSLSLSNVSFASVSFIVNLTTCSSLVDSETFSFFKELNVTQTYSIATIVSTHLIMHAKIEEHSTNCRAKQNIRPLLALTPPDNRFELLHPSIHMSQAWSGMLRCLWWGFCFPSSRHNTRAVLAVHGWLYYLFPPNMAVRTSLTGNCGRREERRLKKEQRETGKKGLEEALIQETGRSWHKDERQSSGSPQGLGPMCRHNERSQTYPASLISTIKAIFSAQHAAASSAICKSPHLSPKIKTSREKALS